MENLTNIINHFGLVIDESLSMKTHKDSVIKVVDSLTAKLAKDSEDLNQETRLSVWAFNSRGTERCLVWDIDVLRMPSINGMYNPGGMTALIDCTLLAINDLKMVPTKYGDHSFVLYAITDGQENHSRNRFALRPTLESMADNWTFGVFVPNNRGVKDATGFGFPKDNVKIWNPSDVSGFESVGTTMQTTSRQLMENRARGIRGTKSLFKLETVSHEDIVSSLKPVLATNYRLLPVFTESRIDQFVQDRTGMPYHLGSAYYELMKTETIQPQKKIAILHNNRVYSGREARQILGLPDYHVKVTPSDHPGYKIFVQSRSVNRKLIPGTSLLLLY